MTPRPAIIATLTVVGTLGVLAYLQTSDDDEPSTVVSTAPKSPPPQRAESLPIAQVSAPETAPAQPALAQPIATNDVAQWIADTQSNDSKKRAVAIEALANAPKAQAVPALERVLESGDPQVDRQIALRSLHVLALNDGDDTGAIRDVIRHAMYHSEDEGVTQSAQAFLEDIEAALAERTESATN